MPVNIPSSQIYAGRYHYQKTETPNLLDKGKDVAHRLQKLIRDVAGVDTVTFSDEGLARANAREWRDYAENNEALFHNGATSREELYKELNVVNNLDTASMFNCELGEVAEQIQKENGFGDRSQSHEQLLSVMAKAYQVIYDRIEEEFSDPDREPTWIRQENGTLAEETKQDRIDALNRAYNSRAECAAASVQSMAEIEETFHGRSYGKGFMDELQKKIIESWHNAVDEKICSGCGRKSLLFKIMQLISGLVRRGAQESTHCCTNHLLMRRIRHRSCEDVIKKNEVFLLQSVV